jgi:hypothetical protein
MLQKEQNIKIENKINKEDLKKLLKNVITENVKTLIYFYLRELKAHSQSKKENEKENDLNFLCNKEQNLKDLKNQLIKSFLSYYNTKTYTILNFEKQKEKDLKGIKSFIKNFEFPYN